jgi:hypothetical protein
MPRTELELLGRTKACHSDSAKLKHGIALTGALTVTNTTYKPLELGADECDVLHFVYLKRNSHVPSKHHMPSM